MVIHWTGAAGDNDFANASNWQGGRVPASGDLITVPQHVLNMPQLTTPYKLDEIDADLPIIREATQ